MLWRSHLHWKEAEVSRGAAYAAGGATVICVGGQHVPEVRSNFPCVLSPSVLQQSITRVILHLRGKGYPPV